MQKDEVRKAQAKADRKGGASEELQLPGKISLEVRLLVVSV